MADKKNTDPPSGFFADWVKDELDKQLALEPFGDSGNGITFLYRSRSGGRNRLYKVLVPEKRGVLLYESILRKEFEIGYSLTHPGICAYYAFVPLEGMGNAIELEWIEGCTLRKWIQQNPSREQRMAVLEEILDALAYMHLKQVLHRDLKPDNIMITYQGNHVKIIDFGFSDSDAHAINKGAAGTRKYAAPEILEGGQASPQSDIWSVGAIMEELSPWLGTIAKRCRATSPDHRYGSVKDLQNAIARRRRLWLIPVAAVLVLAATLSFLFRTYGDNALDGLVRETEEAISATISLSE